MENKSIAIFGDLNLDTSVNVCDFPINVGDTLFSVDGIIDFIGGAATNVACGVRALGHDVNFASVVGRDPLAEIVFNQVNNFHLSTKNIRKDWPVTSRTIVLIDQQGNRQCINDPKLANNYTYPEQEAFEVMSNCEFVFTSTQNWCRHVATQAKALGKTVAVDVQALVDIDNYHRSFIQAADIVILSSERLAKHSHELIHQLWYEFDVEVVVVTHGEGGATIGMRSDESIEWEPAFNTGAVVDKTGAGDAFVAGFISAVLEEKTYRQALTHGQLFASSAITTKGSTNGLPNRAEIDMLYTQYCA